MPRLPRALFACLTTLCCWFPKRLPAQSWTLHHAAFSASLGAHALSPEKPSPSRLSHFSARSRVGPTTPQIVVLGCEADIPQPVLLRAIGRGLPAGMGTHALPTPVLGIYRGNRLLAEDTGGALASDLAALARTTGAFPLAPVSPTAFVNYGSALAPSLTVGSYTVAIRSGDTGSGTALFEFYEINAPAPIPFVRNISVRGQTGSGDAALTVGFVISGETPLRLLIRGVGPSLAHFHLDGGIDHPRLEVYRSGAITPLARNDTWGGDAAIADAGRRVAAFPLPVGSRDAALLLTLAPGIYTTQLSPANTATGSGMIEIYLVE